MGILHFLWRFKKWVGRHYWHLYSKEAFLQTLSPRPKILDVGCGNNSPQLTKTWRPDCCYVGLDVGDYNQDASPDRIADKYILSSSENFASTIESLQGNFDGVISAHNIEHCDDPNGTLKAMLNALRIGGRIYLAFPSEASVRFPSRIGTLNFYDDPTHKHVLNFEHTCRTIEISGFRIDVAVKRNRPLCLAIPGLLKEPFYALQKRVSYQTWALYGFESIIWATRVI